MEEALHTPYHKKLCEVALGSTRTQQIPWHAHYGGRVLATFLMLPEIYWAWHWLSITLDDTGRRQQHNLETVDHSAMIEKSGAKPRSVWPDLKPSLGREEKLNFRGKGATQKKGWHYLVQWPTLLRNSETEYCETITILSNVIISNIPLS